MNRNVKIAKQLVKLAKSLISSEPAYLSDNEIQKRISCFWLSEFECDGSYDTPNGRRYDVCAVVEFPNADEDDGGDFDNSRSVWFKVDADSMDDLKSNVGGISDLLYKTGDMNDLWLPNDEMRNLCKMLAQCWVKTSFDGTGKKYKHFGSKEEFDSFAR